MSSVTLGGLFDLSGSQVFHVQSRTNDNLVKLLKGDTAKVLLNSVWNNNNKNVSY